MLKIKKQKIECVLLTFCLLGLMFNTLFGAFSALGFLISGLIFIILYENKVLNILASNWLLLMIPLLGVFSFIWSDIPLFTLRGGVQLLLTTIFALIIATVVSFELLLKVTGICFLLIMGLCLVSERYALNGITGEFSLIGIFDSKNFLSMNAALSVFTGIAIFKYNFFNFQLRFFGFLLVVLSFLVLLKASSLGSIVTTSLVIIASLFFIYYQSIRLPRRVKSYLNWIFVSSFLLLLVFIIFIGNSTVFDDFMFGLGKDPTLTGRTFIWARGLESISENPMFGLGFQSAFYEGNPLAEEIWEFAHVPSGSGFNFHNMYIDIAVEIGGVGFFIFVLLLVQFIRRISDLEYLKVGSKEGFAIMIFLYMFLQTFLEAAWFSQFTISHFFTCVAWVYLQKTTELKSIKLRWNV